MAYTPEEKLEIARILDEIHVPILDVGIPVVSKEEARSVRGLHRLIWERGRLFLAVPRQPEWTAAAVS